MPEVISFKSIRDVLLWHSTRAVYQAVTSKATHRLREEDYLDMLGGHKLSSWLNRMDDAKLGLLFAQMDNTWLSSVKYLFYCSDF